jgi:hypothetical protein
MSQNSFIGGPGGATERGLCAGAAGFLFFLMTRYLASHEQADGFPSCRNSLIGAAVSLARPASVTLGGKPSF